MSGLLFAIAIDPMLQELNKHSPTLALADDLVAIVDGEWHLNQYLALLHSLCTQYGFAINKRKSVLIQVRKDRRQPARTGMLRGYQFQDSYKYLGVEIDSCLRMDAVMKKRKEI